MDKVLCKICGEGVLTEKIDTSWTSLVTYKGHVSYLDVQYSVCDGCGSEQADARQVELNKKLVDEFKQGIDLLIKGTQ